MFPCFYHFFLSTFLSQLLHPSPSSYQHSHKHSANHTIQLDMEPQITTSVEMATPAATTAPAETTVPVENPRPEISKAQLTRLAARARAFIQPESGNPVQRRSPMTLAMVLTINAIISIPHLRQRLAAQRPPLSHSILRAHHRIPKPAHSHHRLPPDTAISGPAEGASTF